MLVYRLFIENVWKNAIKKFLRPDLQESDVAFYVNKFKELKNSKSPKQFQDAVEQLGIEPKSKNLLDINTYDKFEDLEKIVDYLSSVYTKPPKEFNLDIQIEGAKTIYKDSEVEIYRGLTRKACIEYSTGYGWCIGRSGAGNLYYSYRLGDDEPTFYFVKDLKKIEQEQENGLNEVDLFKDKHHFFVIQVYKNSHEKKVFIVTSARNDGDKRKTWEEIVDICPALRDKKDLFKHIPLNELERKAKDKFFDKPLPPLKEFAKLSYEEKQIFLAVRVKYLEDLPDEYFFLLPDSLKKEFMAMKLGLTPRMYMYIIKDKDLDRYRLEIGDRILTHTNQNVNINHYMVYYFLGLNMDKYINIKHKNKFDKVIGILVSFEGYANKNYYKKYLKYTEHISNFNVFFEQVMENSDDSDKIDDIIFFITNSGKKTLFDILPYIIIYGNEEIIQKYKSDLNKLDTDTLIEIIFNSQLRRRDWVAESIDESKLNLDILYTIFVYCSKKTLQKFINFLHKFDSNFLCNLLEYSRERDWIVENILDSQIDGVLSRCIVTKYRERTLKKPTKYNFILKKWIMSYFPYQKKI